MMLTLEEVKNFLKVEHYSEDDLITNLLDAGYKFAENYTNQVIVETEKTDYFDIFDDIVTLKYYPVISITSVGYNDSSGVAQVLTENQDFYLNNDTFPATLEPVTDWPDTDETRNNVVITYNAGYADIDKTIDQAVLLIIGSLYEQRENHVLGLSVAAVPVSAEYLLTPYRVYAT